MGAPLQFFFPLPSEATKGRGSTMSKSGPSNRGPEFGMNGEPAMKEGVEYTVRRQ